ncbi:MAG: hypothetical protein JKP92_01795 [Alphaproteobacteria bacterium]|jgi:hypothetical protein|nr:hypothetical protein [Alphaproteobacteria bacterium]
MRAFTGICAVLLVCSLAACASTGGTIGGLFPAPKLLKGQIEGDVYTAPDGAFSVAVPYRQGTEEFTYMSVKEQYMPGGAYVSFGPAAFNNSIYRLGVAYRPPGPDSQAVPFGEAAAGGLQEVIGQLQKGYGAPLVEEDSRPDSIHGRLGHYWRFGQRSPDGRYASGAAVTLTHEAYAVDFGHGVALFWVENPDIPGSHGGMDARTFAESWVLHR